MTVHRRMNIVKKSKLLCEAPSLNRKGNYKSNSISIGKFYVIKMCTMMIVIRKCHSKKEKRKVMKNNSSVLSPKEANCN